MDEQITKEERAAIAMRSLGGAFMCLISDAWFVADPYNRQRLQAAFAPEFLKYEALSRMRDPEMQP